MPNSIPRAWRMHGALFALTTLTALTACGDDQDPNGAAALWARIHAEGYTSWARAPGYATRQPSRAAHGNAVEIFVNDVAADAIAAEAPLSAWPTGTLIVKNGYDGADPKLVAAMEKRPDGWYWVEWSATGDSRYSGKPSLCIDCHSSGEDSVRAFPLPK